VKKNRGFKILIKTLMVLMAVFLVLIIGLSIYSSTSYQSLTEMDTAIDSLDLSAVTMIEKNSSIKYTVSNAKMNIIFIPGGLVDPDSYKYLASGLALEGYNVTIVKVLFNLAILTPNTAKKYIDDTMDNAIIGHSLGGVVASMVASGNENTDKIILLGSYPIKDIKGQDSLIITAEHDDAMDQEKFNASLQYVNGENTIYNIDGGNHAQFGWYGIQKGDGTAEISTLVQQNLVISQISLFLDNN